MQMKMSALQTELDQALKSLKNKEQQLEKKDLHEKEEELHVTNEALKILKEHLESNEKTLSERDAVLMATNNKLQHATEQVKEKISQLENINKLLSEKETQLKNTDEELETSKNKLETLGQELGDKKRQLQEMTIILEQQKTELAEKNKQLEEKERCLTERETRLMERDKQLQEKERLVEEKTKQLQEQTDPEPSAPIRRRNSKDELPPIMSEETQDSAAPIRRENSIEGGRPSLEVLRLVLLGRTGSGKSAAENTILSREGKNQAATATSTSISTQQSESTQGEVAGRKVTVVDTPDWFFPELSLEKLRQDVEHCVRQSAPGPHAFLLVIPVKQPTGEERGMLKKMEEIFGERCWKNTMIIFSVTDELQKKNIEEFIQSGDQEVQRLLEKCGNRFHCLNIKEHGDGSQVSELLEKIEKMVEGKREKFYSSELYLEIESQFIALETIIQKERKEKRMREEMEVKEKINKDMQNSLRKIEGAIQKHEEDIRQLNDRTTELERKMIEERHEEKKRELEMDLKQEVEKRTKLEEKVKKLKENREKERREVEERHKQEMEKIRKVYEGEDIIETERNLMKIILPELRRNIMASKTMREGVSRDMEKKNRELEIIEQKLSELTSCWNRFIGKERSDLGTGNANVTGD
ncbi:uncharacterized protein Hap1MRO34_026486 isoform 1-T2 [Clarias gariepinus]